jgi:hypothetical protein
MKPIHYLTWNRGEEGQTESKCGLYMVAPLYWGRTTAQAYEVTGPNGFRRSMLSTQTEGKLLAQKHFFAIVQDAIRYTTA